MDWSADGWRSAFRIELRVQAIGFASRGWPVVPGTFPLDSRWSGGGDLEDTGPQPAFPDWQERPDHVTTSSEDAASPWNDQPYSLLVATGSAVEAVEADAELGRKAASALRSLGAPVPIVSTPEGRWFFLVSGGRPLYRELADTGRVRLHGEGSWVPMPPTTFHRGVAHWRVHPEVCGWHLPSNELVQDAFCLGGGLGDSSDDEDAVRPAREVVDLLTLVR